MIVDTDSLRDTLDPGDVTGDLIELLRGNEAVETRGIRTVYNTRDRQSYGWTTPASITFRGTNQPKWAATLIDEHYDNMLDSGHDLTPVVEIGRVVIYEEQQACIAVELYDEPERKNSTPITPWNGELRFDSAAGIHPTGNNWRGYNTP